jgi:hypothetical protein
MTASVLLHASTMTTYLPDGGTARSRRDFLRLLGLGGAAALLPLGGCADSPFDPAASAAIDLRDDVGRMNGLYALLQLKGETFERLRRTHHAGRTAAEASAFGDITDHTAAHIQFVSRWLQDRRIYDLLLFDFQHYPLGERGPALALARVMAEAVAAAHLWTVGALENPALALAAAKMTSVHARHAAVVRGFGGGDQAFAAAPAISAGGRGATRPLGEVLESFRPFFRSELEIRS